MKYTYQIIYLNGPSSAGKTPLARDLQNTLQEPFLVFGLDQTIEMMAQKYNNWNIPTNAPGFSIEPEKDNEGNNAYEIHAGPYGQRILQTVKDVTVTLARTGHKVIIDDVSIGKEQVDAWRAALKDFKVLWVGVTAPLDILEQREKDREDRIQGLTQWQAERVHVGVKYDIVVDTYHKTLDENVELILSLLQ